MRTVAVLFLLLAPDPAAASIVWTQIGGQWLQTHPLLAERPAPRAEQGERRTAPGPKPEWLERQVEDRVWEWVDGLRTR